MVTGYGAGAHVALWPATRFAEETLIARTANRGVGVYGIAPYFMTQPSRKGLVLGYSRMKEDDIARACAGSARCSEDVDATAPFAMISRKALVRRPSTRLAEGIVDHIERVPVDYALAVKQWEQYVAMLRQHEWETIEVAQADHCPAASSSRTRWSSTRA